MDAGLHFLEFFHAAGAAQAADAALFEAALLEAVVDRRPGVRPDGSGPDPARDPVGSCDVVGEDAGGETEFGCIGALDRIGLVLEYLEAQDRAEHLLLYERRGEILDLDQAGPVKGARRERTFGHGPATHEDFPDRQSVV